MTKVTYYMYPCGPRYGHWGPATQRAGVREYALRYSRPRPQYGQARLRHGDGGAPRYGHERAAWACLCAQAGRAGWVSWLCTLCTCSVFGLSIVSEFTKFFRKNKNKIKGNRIIKKKEYKNFKNFLVYDLIYKIFILHLL